MTEDERKLYQKILMEEMEKYASETASTLPTDRSMSYGEVLIRIKESKKEIVKRAQKRILQLKKEGKK